MVKKILAFDFGASSGRAMIGTFENNQISLQEIHRFSNDPVIVSGTIYWDVLRLYHEIKQGIIKAVSMGGFDAIGIDTWGVDFGIIGKDGTLLANPYNYRDDFTIGMMEEAFARIDKQEVYNKTGIQFMRLNTIFQILALSLKKQDLLSRADKILLMPDLFGYFLTGEKKCEYSNATTTQLINATTQTWDLDLCQKLGIPTDILPPIIASGEQYGILSDDVVAELNAPKVPVIAVASHDTASAIVATPCDSEDFIYISCGTWSLFGTEIAKPIINEKTFSYNLTNEGGYGNKITLLKNIMGLWLIQQSKKYWENQGEDVSYASLEKDALSATAFKCFIDVDEDVFSTPGNMPARVQKYCKQTNQYIPITKGEIMRCIYESLALKYRVSLDMIKNVTGKSYPAIHMIGGGTKDNLLCQMTANSCDTQVLAGPIEATVTGNVAACLIKLGAVENLAQAREIVKNSTSPIHYTPTDTKSWDNAYDTFKQVLSIDV